MFVDKLKTQDARQVWRTLKIPVPGAKEAWEKFWNDDFQQYVDYLKQIKKKPQ